MNATFLFTLWNGCTTLDVFLRDGNLYGRKYDNKFGYKMLGNRNRLIRMNNPNSHKSESVKVRWFDGERNMETRLAFVYDHRN